MAEVKALIDDESPLYEQDYRFICYERILFAAAITFLFLTVAINYKNVQAVAIAIALIGLLLAGLFALNSIYRVKVLLTGERMVVHWKKFLWSGSFNISDMHYYFMESIEFGRAPFSFRFFTSGAVLSGSGLFILSNSPYAFRVAGTGLTHLTGFGFLLAGVICIALAFPWRFGLKVVLQSGDAFPQYPLAIKAFPARLDLVEALTTHSRKYLGQLRDGR